MMALLPAACRGPFPVFLCCLLTLVACFDSQLAAPFSTGTLSPLSQGSPPSQESANDDEMLDLNGPRAHPQAPRGKARFPWAVRAPRVAFHDPRLAPSSRRPLPGAPLGEHECRNGIGAPLLC